MRMPQMMNQESRNSGKDCFLFFRKSLSSIPVFLISISALFAAASAAAGDAVAIGYNKDGVWTDITYYASSTPKGGKDYKVENGAREEAIRDLRKRTAYGAITFSILSSSDSTGFAAVARGADKLGKDINVVGRGKSQKEADENALAELKKTGATKNPTIVYRYFSNGSDAK